MRYRLVLQWPASSVRDYDALIEVENALMAHLSAGNEVDGHDAGSREMNIFIRTDDPHRTFLDIKKLLGTHDFWNEARVAYREATGSKYTILWPENLRQFKIT
jgi:hypothetical protein